MGVVTGDRAEAPAPAEESLQTLLEAVRQLSLARSLQQVQATVRTAARSLVAADGASLVLREGDECFYADEDAVSPLWKGQRFPLSQCISGWTMLHGEPAVIGDIYLDPRIPHEAYRPTFVKSLVMVPIRAIEPLGSIGVYWAEHHVASEREVGLTRALADSTAVALEHVILLEELERTRALSRTDPLTGLPNRRAWDDMLGHTLTMGERSVCAALIDLDDFKAYNDVHGHQAGDAVLKTAGEAWRAALRSPDVVARLGGDEFGVLMPDCELDQAVHIAKRLQLVVPAGLHASIGVGRWNPAEDGASLINRIDAALYAAKGLEGGAIALAR